jgi:hypothetical protein
MMSYRGIRLRPVPVLLALGGCLMVAVLLMGAGVVARARATSAVTGAAPSDVPYALPVRLPASKSSPDFASDAPYTPVVLSLIAQLEPSNPPTQAELANADQLLHAGSNPTCHNVGPVAAPTGTTPSIMPMCWTDAEGVNVTSGPNAGQTTGPTSLLGLGASFDRQLANVWAQTEGTESRELMVTGLYGPQTDLDRLPNWGRDMSTTGEDPFLSNQMTAAQINGLQGVGTMSQMKHFLAYNGSDGNSGTVLQDQPMHELYATPYEGGVVEGRAASTMCSYQFFQDPSTKLPASVSSLSATAPKSPYSSGQAPRTWPLNEPHYACEQPLSENYFLHDIFGSQAFVASDYGASTSTSESVQGMDQDMPLPNGYLSDTHTLTAGSVTGTPFLSTAQIDPTGSTCADAAGNYESCSVAGAVHVAGIPNHFQGAHGTSCPNTYGCALVDSVVAGNLPLSVFNQSLARLLYEEQRFGMLGCDQTPVATTCTNPGGINGDRSGTAPLPQGPSSGATPVAGVGTKTSDAAVAEKMSEEGAVLFKNGGHALPITRADLAGGVLVTGVGAEYTIATPTSEAALGFADRARINPLQQLKAFSGAPGAFTYVPANSPSGEAVPSAVLSTSTSSVTGHLDRTSGPGAPTTDSSLDFTTVSTRGQLAPGAYTWTGYIYVPKTDNYTFRFQVSSSVPAPTSRPIVGQSWSGGVATLSLASGAATQVGSQIQVGLACPSGYDGNFKVTASTATSVSYALPSDPGACTTTLPVTGGSWAANFPPYIPSQATLTFAATTPPSVGSQITVSGVQPAGYNGTFTVVASTPTSATYALSSDPGEFISGGTVAPSATGFVNGGSVLVSLDGNPLVLSTASPAYGPSGQFLDGLYDSTAIPGSPTNAGYTEAGLTNLQAPAASLSPGFHPVTISFANSSSAPASFRFAYSRQLGDIADAAAAAKGKKLAIVFVDDNGANTEAGPENVSQDQIPNPYGSTPPNISAPESMQDQDNQLVQAVAAANPNTVVVVNSYDPVLMPWVTQVKSVLQMWLAGQEGGTATARLLLGLADPSGHTPITWPAHATDTIWGYNEKVPLYPGDKLGPHFERLNGNGGCVGAGCPADTATRETEGIYSGYRFFDKEGITPLFPFGFGLSYTTFGFSHLHVTAASDGGANVSFSMTNTGGAAGADVAQVYVGPPSDQPAGVQFAVRSLAQFDRQTLAPGQTQRLRLHIGSRQLSYWSEAKQKWVLDPDGRTIYVGDADALSRLPVHATLVTRSTRTLTCADDEINGTVIDGNLLVPRGQWCDLVDVTVRGDLLAQSITGLRVDQSTVLGDLTARRTRQAVDPMSSGTNVVCGSTIRGSLKIIGSAPGSPWNLGSCGANTVSGSVTLDDNGAPLANPASTRTSG